MLCAVVAKDDRLGPLREILSDDAYQKAWPASEPGKRARSFEGFEGLEMLLLALMIIGAIGLVAALIYRAVEARRLRRIAERPESGAHGVSPLLALGPDRALALAEEGRFTEAIHALFLRALGVVLGTQSGVGLVLGDSLTAREVVRSVQVDDPSRALLHDLLRAVERSVFGGIESTRGDYEACVESARALSSRMGQTWSGLT